MRTPIGDYLRAIRIEHGEKLKTMADKLGVTSAFLSAVENGKKKFPEKWYSLIPNLYSLDKDDENLLENAVMESQDFITINFKDVPTERKQLGIAFARSFNDIDQETREKIMSLLNKEKEE